MKIVLGLRIKSNDFFIQFLYFSNFLIFMHSFIFLSGYAVHSTIYHMLYLATYNHFAWHGTTIYGLLHQAVKE